MARLSEPSAMKRTLREWGPIAFFSLMMLFMTGVVLGHARDGAASFFGEQNGWFNSLVALPIQSIGVFPTYCIGLMLLGFSVWLVAQKPIAPVSRRAIGLVLLVLALSCFTALIGESVATDKGRIWGGAFGELLAHGFLTLGRPVAILLALVLLAFAVVVGQDWFFYNPLRNLLLGHEPKPALAAGLGRSGELRPLSNDIETDDDLIRPLPQKGSNMIGSTLATASGVITPMLDTTRARKNPAPSFDDLDFGAATTLAEEPRSTSQPSSRRESPPTEVRAALAATQESVVMDFEDLDLEGFDLDAELDEIETTPKSLRPSATDDLNPVARVATPAREMSESASPARSENDVLILDLGRGRDEEDMDVEEEGGGGEEEVDTEFEEEGEFEEEEEVEFEEDAEDEDFDDEEDEDLEDEDEVDSDEDEDSYDDDSDDDYDMDDIDEDLFASLHSPVEAVATTVISADQSNPDLVLAPVAGGPMPDATEPTVEEVFAAMAADEGLDLDLSGPLMPVEAALEEVTEVVNVAALAEAMESADAAPEAAEEVVEETGVFAGSTQDGEPSPAQRTPGRRTEGDDWATWMDDPRPAGIASPADRRRRAVRPVTSGQTGISGYFEQPNLFENADVVDRKTLDEAVRAIFRRDQCSVSLLQRELGLTFATAASVVDRLEREGVIGPYQGSGNREILMTPADWDNRKA